MTSIVVSSPIVRTLQKKSRGRSALLAIAKMIATDATEQGMPETPSVPLCIRVQVKLLGSPNDAFRWAPTRPVLTAALLDAFEKSDGKELPDGSPIAISAAVGMSGGETRIISKIVAKRAAEWAMLHHGERIRASGELKPEQLACPKRMNKILARSAFDTIVFLHARALALRAEAAEGELLRIHTTTERLVGHLSRGCGVICCANGRASFERARAEAAVAVKPDCEASADPQLS